MDAFVISKLAFLLAVGVAGFVGSIVLGRLLVKQPEQLRVALWWLLAIILAASCAWVNGGWPFPAAGEPTLDWVRTLIRGASPERSLLDRTTHFCSGKCNSGRRGYSASNRPKWLAAFGVWLLVLRQPL